MENMMNVLIVDDEKIEREGIKYLLSMEKENEAYMRPPTANRPFRSFGQRV